MLYEVMKVMYKLRVLVTLRIVLFIIYPLVEKVGFTALGSKTVINQLIVW